jgi:1,2-dihydroxy-3-keto-5-methylthiopentene dioxygenase
MSRLPVHAVDGGPAKLDSTEPNVIVPWLQGRGIRYLGLPPRPDSGDVLADWADVVDALKAQFGFVTVDVARLTPDHPDRAAIRAKFLSEHVHDDDEVRLFTQGGGGFFLRWDDVVAVMTCTAGDLLSVPKGQRHWFDAGEEPSFTAVRFFLIPEGWVARFTGDPIAAGFPAWTP